ncbi:MAG: hypothetical protein Q8P31_13585 [Bacillota bacterium]|nr:hypothetical protein [Bacillota bacterium]
MSHTLHRRGQVEDLAGDIVVFSMSAKGINDAGSAASLGRFLQLALRYGPVNIGDMKTGNRQCLPAEQIVGAVQDTSIVHAVFDNPAAVTGLLADLREARLGPSVIVSGLFGETGRCIERAGLRPHTTEYSLGIKGNLSRLEPDGFLRLITMCGHGMVSAALVRRTVLDLKRGRCSSEEAASKLARPCECGVFSPRRAGPLLEELAGSLTVF